MPPAPRTPTDRSGTGADVAARGVLAVALAIVVATLVGCQRAPQRILRLGRLGTLAGAATPEASKATVELAAVGPLGEAGAPEVREVAADLDAARIARIELRAEGTATLAHLTWRLAEDPRFLPYRKLSFPSSRTAGSTSTRSTSSASPTGRDE